MAALVFPGNTIGLVVRGKTNSDDWPWWWDQHCDCILPNGAPIGFFADDGLGSGGPFSGQGSSGSSGRSSGGRGNKSGSSGNRLQGMVFDYPLFLTKRLHYVDIAAARKEKCKSTVLVLNVTKSEAQTFEGYWNRRKTQAGAFHIVGYNCSTHASEAFIEAGLVDEGISGLDTPDNLYNQLADSSRIWTSHSGYVGFIQAGNGNFTVVIEEK